MGCVAFEETLANIKSQSSLLGNLDERAVEIAVILPLLHQVGWNTGNMAEVYPQSPVDSGGRVDYALKVDGKARILVEVKSWKRPLQEAEENQLAGYCRQANPDLAVLTSGNRWLLYLPPKGQDEAELQLFLEFDITSLEPDKVRKNFEKFLARGRFENPSSIAQVVKEAEGLFAEREKVDEAFRRMTAAWNGLTNQSQPLVDFLQSITEPRPDEELVKQFLDWVQKPLVNAVPENPGTVNNPVPQYITYHLKCGQTYGPFKVRQSAWRYVMDDVCRQMRELYPESFDRILDIIGFAKSGEGMKGPIEMASVGLYFEYPSSSHAMGYRQACADVLAKFGYSPDCLIVRWNNKTESPVWPP